MKQPPRIITGSAKGQRLEVPEKGTRPMMDRVKSALFSMIFDFIPEAEVLDVYAGTGALGIECLSRGSKSVVFVDRSRYAITAIHNNLKKTGFESLANVLKSSAARFFDEYEKFELITDKYDIIFFTPPHKDFKEKILIKAESFLKSDGILVAEHSYKYTPEEKIGNLIKVENRIYGATGLSFYKILS